MSLPTAITPATLDTILGQLAAHFLGSTSSTNGNLPEARHAASHVLAAYAAETEEELRLAAEIISFGLHALEALSEAASPDLPAAEKHLLRRTAVTLSRGSHKSQRKLDQLRRARQAAAKPLEPPSPDQPDPATLIELARDAFDSQSWTLTRQQRRAAERIAEKPRRNQAQREARRAALAAAKTASHTGAV